MIRTMTTGAAALLATTGLAHAVGLDRSNQDVGLIFEDGNYVELTFAQVNPDVSGTDNELAPGLPRYEYEGVGLDYTQLGFGAKVDITPQISMAVIYDQPFGVDVSYPGDPAVTYFGGTEARLDSDALTVVGRYRINDSFSVHGGLRYEKLSANVTLAGQGYGALSGYNVDLAEDSGTGYLIGAAYERPDIALRVAVTYHSAIEHEFDTVETVGGIPVNLINPALGASSTTTVETPEAINIDLQTGIAADTLAFANIRYAWYDDVIVSPVFFDTAQDGERDNDSLTEIEDNYGITVGIGRRFSDAFSGTVSVGYEAEGSDDLVSPLAPTNGNYSVGIGAQYTVGAAVISAGLRHTWLGDARPETGTPDVDRASFTDNTAVAAGMSIGFRF
ncbi:OmpP1/FadL family transporter [Wenxinia saemankumensis]|uniref:Long-chain fatty acid transport protein n=1 Tax=Wenxinia saemankumensis TaxID=1447782 RepID=A0A1M6HHU2_9RHOB|nr:outer membrane protein transport protein [Wenxinia saemankumensis]SHJ21796.1 Long-chain fatty acid transport protein [Wenxinia saemankumensis]